MFSLIITVISIALVAALALATLYYGGTAFSKGASKAEATKILLQGQQLMGAATLFYTDAGRWPLNMAELVSSKYLSAIPVAELAPSGLLTAANAAAAAWTMPKDSTPVFVLQGISSETVCGQVNREGSLKTYAISTAANPASVSQCFGANGTPMQVVMKQNTAVDSLIGVPGIPASFVSSPAPTPPWREGWGPGEASAATK